MTAKLRQFFVKIGNGCRQWLAHIGDWFKALPARFAVRWHTFCDFLKNANGKVAASCLVMGLGQLLYHQWAKGLIFLAVQAAMVLFFVFVGAKGLVGLFTLGTVEGNAWYGIEGDNSVIMLLLGILSVIALVLYAVVYTANIRDVYRTQSAYDCLKTPPTFRKELSSLLDRNFYKVALALPILGVCVFCVLPIIFMILIAFTNYGGTVVPPRLIDWVGLDNFGKILTLSDFAPTFFRIFGWNILWAVMSTFINYFAGLGLALLLNRKCVKGKVFWRLFPILAYAVPGFITLIGFKFMFSYGGPINYYITQSGGSAVGFLDIDAKWSSRLIGLGVNAWLCIPSSMLLATGILSNLNTDLYEAARVDGAGNWKQFTKITLPYVLFATMPVLISQFIGNFNNFGIFYFLRGGLYLDGYFLASDTDLLINWLYNMSIDNNYYSIGAAISIVIFIVTSVISLTVYVLSPSYRQEDTYQ